jgi:two-component system phosphate regulon sensor histidine kinase PhoR
LLDNAAKYCADKKEISVSLQADAANVILEIEDQGIGIPNSEQARIFEQFYRAENSRDIGGHGLGLFLVKHIMDAHGGTIEVKSEPGRGSLFRLIFPINHNGREAVPDSGR